MYKYIQNSNIYICVHMYPIFMFTILNPTQKTTGVLFLPEKTHPTELRLCRVVDFEMPFPIPSATLSWWEVQLRNKDMGKLTVRKDPKPS